MTSPASEQSRRRPLHIAIAVWLGLMSIFVVVDHLALSKLKRATSSPVLDPAISKRLADLEQQVAGIAGQEPGASAAALAATRAELDGRLAKIEQLAGSRASTDEMYVLQERLGSYEAKLSRMKRLVAESRTAPVAPVQPSASQPPFTALGIELRGGERVLTLLPTGSQSLADVRLLRVGERQANWHLEALNENTAEFRVDGRQQRLLVR